MILGGDSTLPRVIELRVIRDALGGLNEVTHKIAEMIYSGKTP